MSLQYVYLVRASPLVGVIEYFYSSRKVLLDGITPRVQDRGSIFSSYNRYLSDATLFQTPGLMNRRSVAREPQGAHLSRGRRYHGSRKSVHRGGARRHSAGLDQG